MLPAIATGAAVLLLFWRGGTRRLRAAGYDTTRWFGLGLPGASDGYVSPDHPDRRRATWWASGVRPPLWVRRLVVQAAMTAGVPLPGREVLTVATAPGRAPGWAALAQRAGADVGTSRSWFLATPGTEARVRGSWPSCSGPRRCRWPSSR